MMKGYTDTGSFVKGFLVGMVAGVVLLYALQYLGYL